MQSKMSTFGCFIDFRKAYDNVKLIVEDVAEFGHAKPNARAAAMHLQRQYQLC